MSNCTITFHLGTTLSQSHNVRDPKITAKEPHIDPNGQHETLIHEDVESAYKRLFDDALAEYNEKQKKPCRRIADYYEHIKGSKEHHACYEAIIGVYGKDEYGNEAPNAISRTECTRMLKQYLEQFQAENPQLHVIGAYIHADEEGKYPHLKLKKIEKTHSGEALKNAVEQLERQKKELNLKNKAFVELQEELKTEKKLRFLKEEENKKLALELQKTEHSFRQMQEVLKTAVKWIELVMTSLKPDVQKSIREFITKIVEAGFIRKTKTRSR